MISIIIPVYNAEKTIRRAIDSVESQSRDDWELLLIDDGSSDRSPEICKNAADSDSRIKYCRQNNSGPAVARNMGIELATGEYLAFLDADDTYQPDFLKEMLSEIERFSADMVICGFNKISEKQIIRVKQPFGALDYGEYVPFDSYLRLFFKNNPGGIASLCTKLYKRDLLLQRNIRLDQDKVHGEDWKFNLDLLCTGPIKIKAVDKQLYNYYDTPKSITKKYRLDKRYQMFSSARLLLDINSKYCLGEEASVYRDHIIGIVSHGKGICSLDIKNKYYFIQDITEKPLSKEAFERIYRLGLSRKMILLAQLLKSRIGFGVFYLLAKIKR